MSATVRGAGRGRGTPFPPLQLLRAREITASREEGEGNSALPAQGRMLTAFQNQRGPEGGPRASLPQRGPQRRVATPSGFSADLVIVVNADGDERRRLASSSRIPQTRAPSRQRGSDHWERGGRAQGSGARVPHPQHGMPGAPGSCLADLILAPELGRPASHQPRRYVCCESPRGRDGRAHGHSWA